MESKSFIFNVISQGLHSRVLIFFLDLWKLKGFHSKLASIGHVWSRRLPTANKMLDNLRLSIPLPRLSFPPSSCEQLLNLLLSWSGCSTSHVQIQNIPILPEAFLTFASKSSIGPSCAAHGPYTPCTPSAVNQKCLQRTERYLGPTAPPLTWLWSHKLYSPQQHISLSTSTIHINLSELL